MHILLFKSFFKSKHKRKTILFKQLFQRILKHKKSSNFQKHFKLCENGLIRIIFKFISNTKLLVVRGHYRDAKSQGNSGYPSADDGEDNI